MSTGGTFSIDIKGALKGDGTIINAVTNGGVVAPGATIGEMHITGGYSQSSVGTLQIELAAQLAALNLTDLRSARLVSLSGTLTVSLAGSFLPSSGTSFDILDWGSLSGTFSSIQLPGLGGGLQWNTTQLYTTGVISVGLPGDFNHDGTVDAAAYVLWRKKFRRHLHPGRLHHLARTSGKPPAAEPVP